MLNEFPNSSYLSSINDRTAYSSLISIFRGIANRVVTDEMFDDFGKLMIRYELTNSTIETLNALIEENLEWIKKNSPIIDNFLNRSRMIATSLAAILFGFFV